MRIINIYVRLIHLERQFIIGPGGDDVWVRHLGAYIVQRGQHARAGQHAARQRGQRRQAEQTARLLYEQLRSLRSWIHCSVWIKYFY